MSLYVTQQLDVSPSHEPAVLITVRELERIIERVDDCKPSGWADLWLAWLGVGAALAVGAFVVALTLPGSSSGTRDILWALTATGVVVLLLCLAGYLTQRHEHSSEIGQLRKDLEIHRPAA